MCLSYFLIQMKIASNPLVIMNYEWFRSYKHLRLSKGTASFIDFHFLSYNPFKFVVTLSVPCFSTPCAVLGIIVTKGKVHKVFEDSNQK